MPDLTTTANAILLLTPQVTATTPIPSATGISTGQNVIVTFNTPMDIDSVTTGRITITQTADQVAATGPGLFTELLTGNLVTTNLLSTPTLRGIVAAAITYDTARQIFTINPNELLSGNQQYTVLISNEVVSRTLSAVTPGGGNTGTGSLTVRGPYTGTYAPDTYTVEITTAGAINVAIFRWRKASDGVWHTANTTDRVFPIENGITLRFAPGQYNLNDSFTFTATQGIALGATYQFVFTTGSPTYTTPSTQVESNEVILEEIGGITRIASTPTPIGVGFRVVSIDPELRSTDLDLTTKLIRITFNKNIDANTVTDDSIQLLLESLPTDHSTRFSRPMAKHLSVSGATLTISIDGA